MTLKGSQVNGTNVREGRAPVVWHRETPGRTILCRHCDLVAECGSLHLRVGDHGEEAHGVVDDALVLRYDLLTRNRTVGERQAGRVSVPDALIAR